MEFFAIADVRTEPETLQSIDVASLDQYCADIDKVISVEDPDRATVWCVWGEFRIHRHAINGGVRFTMPDCPNAMSWTITTGYEPDVERVVIHATINRSNHDPDFIESIEDWVKAWKGGLENQLSGLEANK